MKVSLKSLLLLIALWWLLAGDETASWVIGFPSVCTAWVVRTRLRPFPSATLSVVGVARFLICFFKLSIVGGLDVVRRVFHPRMPMNPGVLDYFLRLSSPAERIMVAGTVSLLPGTLSADLNQDRLTLHVLDLEAPIIRDLQHIEDLVAGLYAPARAAVSRTRDDHG